MKQLKWNLWLLHSGLIAIRRDIFCFLHLFKELLTVGVNIILIIYTLNSFTLEPLHKCIKELKDKIEILFVVIPMPYIVFFFIWLPLHWDSLLLMNNLSGSGMNSGSYQPGGSFNNTPPSGGENNPMSIGHILNTREDNTSNPTPPQPELNNNTNQVPLISPLNPASSSSPIIQSISESQFTQGFYMLSDDWKPLTPWEEIVKKELTKDIVRSNITHGGYPTYEQKHELLCKLITRHRDIKPASGMYDKIVGESPNRIYTGPIYRSLKNTIVNRYS